MCSSVESKDFYNLWKLSWTNKKILTEAETWMVLGQKRLAVTRHAAVADASLLSFWFATSIHLTSHPLPLHTPQNITHNLHRGEKHTRNWGWGVYLLAQDPASPSLSKPIQFPAQIGVICALGNPPRVTFEEKTANKNKNWNQFRLWNKSICIQNLCPAWLYILTTKLNSCWVTRHVFLVKTSKRVNNFPSSDRMWSLTKCAHGAGSSCQQCLENNWEQGGLTTCQNTPQSLSLF